MEQQTTSDPQKENLERNAHRLDVLIRRAIQQGWQVEGFSEMGRTGTEVKPGLLAHTSENIVQLDAASAILLDHNFLKALFPENWQEIGVQVFEKPTNEERILFLNDLLTDQELQSEAELAVAE